MAASHSASSVVFPEPAGAEMSVSRDSAPRRNRPLSRGRATRLRRSFGGFRARGAWLAALGLVAAGLGVTVVAASYRALSLEGVRRCS